MSCRYALASGGEEGEEEEGDEEDRAFVVDDSVVSYETEYEEEQRRKREERKLRKKEKGKGEQGKKRRLGEGQSAQHRRLVQEGMSQGATRQPAVSGRDIIDAEMINLADRDSSSSGDEDMRLSSGQRAGTSSSSSEGGEGSGLAGSDGGSGSDSSVRQTPGGRPFSRRPSQPLAKRPKLQDSDSDVSGRGGGGSDGANEVDGGGSDSGLNQVRLRSGRSMLRVTLLLSQTVFSFGTSMRQYPRRGEQDAE